MKIYRFTLLILKFSELQNLLTRELLQFITLLVSIAGLAVLVSDMNERKHELLNSFFVEFYQELCLTFLTSISSVPGGVSKTL